MKRAVYKEMRQYYPISLRITIGLLFLVLLVFVLTVARDFLYPVAFAILFAYLLYPIAKWLEVWKVSSGLAVLGSVLIGVAVLSLGVFMLYKQLAVFWDDLPALQQQAFHTVDELEVMLQDEFGFNPNRKGWLRKKVFELFRGGESMIALAFSATTSSLVKIALIPVYTFFLLLYRHSFRNFFLEIASEEHQETAQQAVEDVSLVSRRYVGGLFIVVIILAFLNTSGLLLIGVQHAVLLGIISALANFIPYIGTWIGGGIVLLVTLLTGQAPQQGLAIGLFFLGVNFLENNVLTPNIVGGQVNINPFFALLSIVAGSLLWGLPGMFTAIPFLAMIKVICGHISSLQPLARLLEGGKSQRSSSFWKRIKEWVRSKF